MYSGIHSIDWQCWLLDSEVEQVFARTMTYGQDMDVENGLIATMVFANGCLGTLIGNQPNYLVTSRTRDTEIYGSHTRIRIRSGEYLDLNSDAQAYRMDVTRDDPFATQAQDFVAAVREQRDPWITGEDGLRALAVTMAIYRSAGLGQPVSVSDFL